jgi:hypothetical protein
MELFSNNLVAKNGSKVAKTYYCEKCDYICGKKYNWDKHLSTSKHNEVSASNDIAMDKVASVYSCEHCNKIYGSRNGLWRHKTKGYCTAKLNEKKEPIDKDPTDKEMMMMVFKQNTDLIKDNADIKQLILELVKNGITNNSHNNTINNTNSHNKAFNLNFFLNETCKNAMNITEFVDSIKWELEDLMELGEIGYVASMSKIITKNLNALDETIRPIHCTDKKRETFYIKDEDKWEKEDEEMKRLRKIILRISNKSMKLLPKYREKFPDYDDAKSIHSDELCKIIIEAVTCDSVKDEKIIRNISRITTISHE